MTSLRLIAAALLCAMVVGRAPAIRGQADSPDGVALLVQRLNGILDRQDRVAFGHLFAGVPAEQVEAYAADLFMPGALRTTIRLRSRAPLEGVPPGAGFRLVMEFFVESGSRGRLLTTGLDVRRPPTGETASWRIARTEGLSSIDGLYRLRLNAATQYTAHQVRIVAEDLDLTLVDGTVFEVICDEGVTGLVLLGRGEMRFSPAPAAERGQLRIFAGHETLVTPFESAFVRINPGDLASAVAGDTLRTQPVDPDRLAAARAVFAREAPRSFVADLRDLSTSTWHVIPSRGDLRAEIRTRKYDTLTYSRLGAQAEDITVFQRKESRTIALYASAAKIAARGRSYTEDTARDYDVLDYNIDAAIDPERGRIRAQARVAIRTRVTLSTILLRLANPLAVSGITSVELGPLPFLRLADQHAIVVSLPRLLGQDADVTLFVAYEGELASLPLQTESLQVQAGTGVVRAVAPHYLLSGRSYWYPQNVVPDYATASLRITVPRGDTVVASGEPIPADAAIAPRDPIAIDGQTFLFRAAQPLRYLALAAGRFTSLGTMTVVPKADGDDASAPVSLTIQATSGQESSARLVRDPAADIIRFYATLMRDTPYPALTVLLVDSLVPGGHSPAYFTIVNDPSPFTTSTWRNDPAAFDGFPEFFLAHEIAHQWWGQAVGWKNYHEQWLSEGFAQYFAALYAERLHGPGTFRKMLERFRTWALDESAQGPISLGYRLGHIQKDPRILRALAYNKAAGVLHMLRRLLGDDVFFVGLRQFYQERRFQKAGSDDLQRTLEAVSGRSLDRFFRQWIDGIAVPRVRYATEIDRDAVQVRLDQVGEVFDLPVTVEIEYRDGHRTDVVVVLAEPRQEYRLPVDGPVRRVRINRDAAALATFDQIR